MTGDVAAIDNLSRLTSSKSSLKKLTYADNKEKTENLQKKPNLTKHNTLDPHSFVFKAEMQSLCTFAASLEIVAESLFQEEPQLSLWLVHNYLAC